MAEHRKSAQIDLEKELNCSICTELLYQPLTLLDCLHTFCGSCLKEWFSFQATTAKSLHPYTCPSCRASVRATKPNATVTTLLDMYLKANPQKQRSEEDKLEQREKYRPGDNVLPKLRVRRAGGSRAEVEEDERVVQGVVRLSLGEVGIGAATPTSTAANTLAPVDPRARERSRGSRSRDSSRGATSRDTRTDPTSRRGGRRSSRDPSREPSPAAGRHIAHQSSLRSLMSASELDPQEMQEDILRQIAEEGLLEGIDLENMDPSQEEELSERIARRYHQRREETLRERNRRREAPTAAPVRTSPTRTTTAQEPNTRRVERPPMTEAYVSAPAPPVSNPHLISSANQGTSRQRRSSNSSTRSASRVDAAIAPVVARSSSEMARETPTISTARPERARRMSHERSTTDPDRVRAMYRRNHAPTAAPVPVSPRQGEQRSHSRQRSDSNPRPPPQSPRNNHTFPLDRHTRPTNNSSPSLPTTSQQMLEPAATLAPAISNTRPSSSPSTNPHNHAQVYTEPSISCSRCSKPHIEYDVHYRCPKCSNGNYSLCLRCYRSGKGCLHWYGFGDSAYRKFDMQRPEEGYHPTVDRPHILEGRRYLKPHTPIVPTATPEQSHRMLTEEDPAKRLERGVFCDICNEFASPCYWKCDICNEGAWGYCNTCVNQGRHCTHPLLPLKEKTKSTEFGTENNTSSFELTPLIGSLDIENSPRAPPTPKSAHVIPTTSTIPLANLPFEPLSFIVDCNICSQNIHPSLSRFHCSKCENGDYDICTNCYLHLVSTGRISHDNGHMGWRRCLQGHRMAVVGFEDRAGGQCRIVVNDVVGGLALKETASPRRFPPNGGVGLRCVANWSYYPDEGVKDELMFPKGAEVREGEDINGDWFWGVYAGGKGLFPGNYCSVLGNGRV
ncbi:hypothetical protein EJ08DRAFT_724396 [Tothia fuscella]|uniref:RING-type domain-containing protein n=1 Tax=Tothia fuscella TaxID=1048955 RepID=A0A9P4TUP9_9PEZI|nr:hypothetical protein EJ08DRAFT_724396 [Tothia fuscella]